MARVQQGFHPVKSQKEWNKIYKTYEDKYEALNQEKKGYHLLSEKYSKEEFIKVYKAGLYKRDVLKEKIRLNALEIARSQRRSNYRQPHLKGRGQEAMIRRLERIKKGLKNNNPEAIAEYQFIKNNPGLQDAFETYTGTTLFDEDWVHYFDPDERTVDNKRGNSYFKKVNNINQASFADNLDSYLDSLGLEHTKDNYTKARDLFEAAIY